MNGINDLVYGLNQRIQAPGSLGVGTVANESKVRFVISNAGLSNLVRVRARINNQPNWTTLVDYTGNTNEYVDVHTWDQIEVIVLVFQSLSDVVSIVASSFDGSALSVITPSGTITNAAAMQFTSTDNSVIITADDSTGIINFASVGAGGAHSESSFVIADWVGPTLGLYSISVPFATHGKINPIAQVFVDAAQTPA